MIKPKVLFLCSDNSCRTQMAEAFLRDMAGERFSIWSAGAKATAIDPEAVAAMHEAGLDISSKRRRQLTCSCESELHFSLPFVTARQKGPAPFSPVQSGD